MKGCVKRDRHGRRELVFESPTQPFVCVFSFLLTKGKITDWVRKMDGLMRDTISYIGLP